MLLYLTSTSNTVVLSSFRIATFECTAHAHVANDHVSIFSINRLLANAKQQIQTRDLFVTKTAAELVDSNL